MNLGKKCRVIPKEKNVRIILLPIFGFRNFKARGKINLDDDFNLSKIMWRTRHLHRIGGTFQNRSVHE